MIEKISHHPNLVCTERRDQAIREIVCERLTRIVASSELFDLFKVAGSTCWGQISTRGVGLGGDAWSKILRVRGVHQSSVQFVLPAALFSNVRHLPPETVLLVSTEPSRKIILMKSPESTRRYLVSLIRSVPARARPSRVWLWGCGFVCMLYTTQLIQANNVTSTA